MSHYLDHSSKLIRKYLSNHFSVQNLKKLSFIISLISCLSSGSIMLFSLFASSLHENVGLSYLEINFIASLSTIGMYLCFPVLGYLSDCYGPSLLSLISIWFFCPSYFFNAMLIKDLEHQRITKNYIYGFSLSFCFIGLATSSLYFSSLLTCAKIYPKHKGLAISSPVSCYGLSSLIGSQLMKLSYFQQGEFLDLFKVFNFFGILYLVMGILNFISNSVVSIEQEIIFQDEDTPLLQEELTPQRSIDPPHHRERYMKFLSDRSAWLLLVSLILNIGPLESFQNNLGSIIKIATNNVNLSNQVSLMAASSTITRLILGALSDYLSSPDRRHPIGRVWLLIVILLVGIAGQFSNQLKIDFSIISVLNGSCYGGLFTTYPTIVASVWGIDIMGSTWGSFMVAPAIGSVIYSLSYGKQVDLKCKYSAACLQNYFNMTTLSLSISLAIVIFVWRRIWWNRGLKNF